jgi:Holliday junction resolvase RusA-like endonuclease
MFHVTFRVDGQPHGKGRPRFTRQGGFVRAYTDAKTLSYESIIRLAAQKSMGASMPLTTALDAFIYISLAIPSSYSKKRKESCLNGLEKPIKKPDIDNVAKSALDACNNVIFVSDSQIVNLHVTKRYGDPHIEVLIRETE